MAIQLFEHNQIAYENCKSMLNETGKACVIHPTGTGKSFIGFKLCEDNSDKIICWLSPSEYIFQTQLENLAETSDGWKPENVAFFTYAKLIKMSADEIAEIQPDYIILDEFHRCGAEQWGTGVQKLLNLFTGVPILGLSATAIRYLDNQRDMSDELFEGNIASEMTLGEAIVRGILNPPKYILSVYSYQQSLEKYELRIQKAKSNAVRDTAKRYFEALRRTLEKAEGLDVIFAKHMENPHGKYIVFCSHIENMNASIAMADKWFSKVDSEPHIYKAYSNDPETSQAFADFKADKSDHLKLLYCIDMLNEGVHVEDISGVILLRPTVSPIIYKQQIGRALSASKSTNPIIFDIVANISNLYSISTIEEEMQEAIQYYRMVGEDSVIINETFQIIDEVKDCIEIFEKLNETLSASWDVMYQQAEKYYQEHGNLEISTQYRTEEGYNLGAWLNVQRRIRDGKAVNFRPLTEEQIEKLDKIGMIWESVRDFNWNKNYSAAKKYYEEHGTLEVHSRYVTEDGIELGRWLCELRTWERAGIYSGYLTPERKKQLEEIGIIWDTLNYYWERNFSAAYQYFLKNRHLDVPEPQHLLTGKCQ